MMSYRCISGNTYEAGVCVAPDRELCLIDQVLIYFNIVFRSFFMIPGCWRGGMKKRLHRFILYHLRALTEVILS
jgi:hypothetical protein